MAARPLWFTYSSDLAERIVGVDVCAARSAHRIERSQGVLVVNQAYPGRGRGIQSGGIAPAVPSVQRIVVKIRDRATGVGLLLQVATRVAEKLTQAPQRPSA